MDIRPIRTEEDYEAALESLEDVFDAEPGTLEGDTLEVLSALIEHYEESVFPIDLPDPISAIEATMQMSGLTQSDLATVFGSRSRASEVLARKRALSLNMIRALQRKPWSIPAEILVQEYEIVTQAGKKKCPAKKSGSASAKGRSSTKSKRSPKKSTRKQKDRSAA